jgi:hypothetical protein
VKLVADVITVSAAAAAQTAKIQFHNWFFLTAKIAKLHAKSAKSRKNIDFFAIRL